MPPTRRRAFGRRALVCPRNPATVWSSGKATPRTGGMVTQAGLTAAHPDRERAALSLSDNCIGPTNCRRLATWELHSGWRERPGEAPSGVSAGRESGTRETANPPALGACGTAFLRVPDFEPLAQAGS